MDILIEQLKRRGAKYQLIMLMTGPSVVLAQQFYHRFCAAVSVAFDNTTFYFTATTGSVAALFGGMTIHSAARLNEKNINDDMRRS